MSKEFGKLVTYREVSHDDLLELLNEHYSVKPPYETSNGFYKIDATEPMDEYDKQELTHFDILGDIPSADVFLKDLAARGIIEKTVYLVEVDY
jgi:hypothetical protein